MTMPSWMRTICGFALFAISSQVLAADFQHSMNFIVSAMTTEIYSGKGTNFTGGVVGSCLYTCASFTPITSSSKASVNSQASYFRSDAGNGDKKGKTGGALTNLIVGLRAMKSLKKTAYVDGSLSVSFLLRPHFSDMRSAEVGIVLRWQ